MPRSLHKSVDEITAKNNSRIARLKLQLDKAREDEKRLDFLDQCNHLTAMQVSDLINGHRWRGRYIGTVREAIDVARKDLKFG